VFRFFENRESLSHLLYKKRGSAIPPLDLAMPPHQPYHLTEWSSNNIVRRLHNILEASSLFRAHLEVYSNILNRRVRRLGLRVG
jgi:transposase-like protein